MGKKKKRQRFSHVIVLTDLRATVVLLSRRTCSFLDNYSQSVIDFLVLRPVDFLLDEAAAAKREERTAGSGLASRL